MRGKTRPIDAPQAGLILALDFFSQVCLCSGRRNRCGIEDVRGLIDEMTYSTHQNSCDVICHCTTIRFALYFIEAFRREEVRALFRHWNPRVPASRHRLALCECASRRQMVEMSEGATA